MQEIKPDIDLKDYRQPMVTSIGVILGFLIGFLGQWVTEGTFSLILPGDKVVFYGCLTGAFCLFVALFRMLSIVSSSDVCLFYKNTLYIYMFGVVFSFGSILASAFL
jgi:hypothetical protein